MVNKSNPKLQKTLKFYFAAKDVVVSSGYHHEIIWQDKISLNNMSLKEFFSEYVWVVLSSGMKETVVRKKFYELSVLFGFWSDPFIICQTSERYRKEALLIFNNPGKIKAIFWMADFLTRNSIQGELDLIKEQGVEYLQSYPFLGPATSYHFAKNIGVLVSKPDRHLVRISDFLGYSSPHLLCKQISSILGEKESIVDLILWRYATLKKNYLTHS